jgi:hypothetical protein
MISNAATMRLVSESGKKPLTVLPRPTASGHVNSVGQGDRPKRSGLELGSCYFQNARQPCHVGPGTAPPTSASRSQPRASEWVAWRSRGEIERCLATTSSASRCRLARSSSLSIGGRSRAARRIRPELWAAPAISFCIGAFVLFIHDRRGGTHRGQKRGDRRASPGHHRSAGSPSRSSPASAWRYGSNETIKQAVMAGLGIAFISAHTIAAEIDDGRLAILDRPARDPAVVRGASSNETNDAGGQQFA